MHSQIRSVKGIGAEFDYSIYPNPAVDGRTQIRLDDMSELVRIQVIDPAGRVIKNIRSVNNNIIQITGLTPGLYHIRVSKESTGEYSIKKLVVIK